MGIMTRKGCREAFFDMVGGVRGDPPGRESGGERPRRESIISSPVQNAERELVLRYILTPESPQKWLGAKKNSAINSRVNVG